MPEPHLAWPPDRLLDLAPVNWKQHSSSPTLRTSWPPTSFEASHFRRLPELAIAQHLYGSERHLAMTGQTERIPKTRYARFDLNDYSVPHDRTRRTLTVLADIETVRIVENNELLTTHARSWDRGQQLETPEHLDRLAAEKKRARQHRGLDRLAKPVPGSQAFLRCLVKRGERAAAAQLQHFISADFGRIAGWRLDFRRT